MGIAWFKNSYKKDNDWGTEYETSRELSQIEKEWLDLNKK